MPETIEDTPLDDGDCVEIHAVHCTSGKVIKECGIILSHQLVEMDHDLFEYLYTVHSPAGIEDYWPYEIKPVNLIEKEYNILNLLKEENNEI